MTTDEKIDRILRRLSDRCEIRYAASFAHWLVVTKDADRAAVEAQSVKHAITPGRAARLRREIREAVAD